MGNCNYADQSSELGKRERKFLRESTNLLRDLTGTELQNWTGYSPIFLVCHMELWFHLVPHSSTSHVTSYIARLLTKPRAHFSVRSPRGESLLNNRQFMLGNLCFQYFLAYTAERNQTLIKSFLARPSCDYLIDKHVCMNRVSKHQCFL